MELDGYTESDPDKIAEAQALLERIDTEILTEGRLEDLAAIDPSLVEVAAGAGAGLKIHLMAAETAAEAHAICDAGNPADLSRQDKVVIAEHIGAIARTRWDQPRFLHWTAGHGAWVAVHDALLTSGTAVLSFYVD